MRIRNWIFIGSLLLGFACNRNEQAVKADIPIFQIANTENLPPKTDFPFPQDRTEILGSLKTKIEKGEALVAHIFVPLCDNANQGIVPVNASLGNGQNTRTNLYWGAGYGIRTHFQRQNDWKTRLITNPSEAWILERAVFQKRFPNGANVFLVADAYDGAFMKQCLNDYFDALCGIKKGIISLDSSKIGAWSEADLLAFNGHNGLMDVEIDTRNTVDGKFHDAVAIACASHSYFAPKFKSANAFPLITTTNLLAPEAYVLRGVIENWAMLKSGEDVRFAAANAYNTFQKCGIKGASRLFHSGW